MIRTLLILPAVASLVLPGCSGDLWSGRAEASGVDDYPSDVPDHITLERIERGMIRDIVPAVGRIKAADQVDVGAEVSGRVIEILADFDDNVSTGDPLVRLDPAPFETAVNRAEAQLAIATASRDEAEARLEASELELARAERLASLGTGPRSLAADRVLTTRQHHAALERANAQVALAQSQLAQARIDLSRTLITAPLDGFVLERRVEVGQSVNAAMSTPVMFVIAANLEHVVIEAEVAEADVARIEQGMQVRFTVDAYPTWPFSGVAGPVRRAPTIRNRFVTYTVPVEASDPDQRLLPGMTASVEFIAAEAIDVVLLPRASRSTPLPREFAVPEDIARDIREHWNVPDDEPLLPDHAGSVFGMLAGRAIRDGYRPVFVWEGGEVRVKNMIIGPEDATHVASLGGDLQVGDWVIVDVRDPVFDQ